MRSESRRLGIVSLLAAVSACSPQAGGSMSACRPVGTWTQLVEQSPTPNVGANVKAEWCVVRAAYMLARAPGPAADLTKAVTYACRDEIGTSALEGDSEDTGEAAPPLRPVPEPDEVQARLAALERLAFLSVIEGRAGECWKTLKVDAPVADYQRDRPLGVPFKMAR